MLFGPENSVKMIFGTFSNDFRDFQKNWFRSEFLDFPFKRNVEIFCHKIKKWDLVERRRCPGWQDEDQIYPCNQKGIVFYAFFNHFFFLFRISINPEKKVRAIDILLLSAQSDSPKWALFLFKGHFLLLFWAFFQLFGPVTSPIFTSLTWFFR